MSDQNSALKWTVVVFSVLAAGLLCYPPDEKLKLGIDLAGGTSLLYEIDTTDLPEDSLADLSTRVMNILKERVDPNQTMNLIWRPVGNTRLEVQMPLPSEAARKRRQEKEAAFNALRMKNNSRYDIVTALSVGADKIQDELHKLVKGVSEREPLLLKLKDAYDALQAKPTDEALRKAYEQSLDAVLTTNLDVTRIRDVLDLTRKKPEVREAELAKIYAEHPGYKEGIMLAATAYDAWAKDKTELEDPSDLKRRLKGAGVLEFRILAERDPGSPGMIQSNDPALRQRIADYEEALHKRGPRVRAGDNYRWFPVRDVVDLLGLDRRQPPISVDQLPEIKDTERLIVGEYAGRWYILSHNDPEYGLTKMTERPWKLVSAYPNRDPSTGQNVVSFALDPVGGDLFAELTENNIKRYLCVFLDGEAMSSATIQSRIAQYGQISGSFSQERVATLVRNLEAGALPGRLKDTPLMEKTIGPSLGEHNKDRGLAAAKWGFLLVVIFIVIYYGVAAGLIADLALVMNLVILLGVMAFLQATFTLPGIAGLVLTVGMAIDANVLIFERIREERDRGVALKKAISTGYEKAFSTIVDANLTTLLTCIILGWVGSEEVKGFAITLGIGIVTSMYTSLFVTRLVFNALISRGWLKKLSMRRLLTKPSIDWMGLRRIFWPVSLTATVLGLGVFLFTSLVRPESMYDIEFLGGTSVQIDVLDGVDMGVEDVRRAVASSNPEDVSVPNWLAQAADLLEETTFTERPGTAQYVLESPSDRLNGEQIVALMRGRVEDLCDKITALGQAAVFTVKADVVTPEQFKQLVVDSAVYIRDKAIRNMRTARVQSSEESRMQGETKAPTSFEIVTVETDRAIVQTSLLAVLGDKLKVQKVVSFRLARDDKLTGDDFFVVKEQDHYLGDVIGGDSTYDIRRYKGGVAIVVDQLEPQLTKGELEKRLLEIRLQPDYETYQAREGAVFPLSRPTTRPDGATEYRKFAILVVDESIPYSEDETKKDQWVTYVAKPELEQVEVALGTSKSLRKVVQFAPQVAAAAQQDAIAAIILALVGIVAYVWVRFGTMQYGLAAIVALVHDVSIALGLITLSHFLSDTPIGNALGIIHFKIDLPMIAALLTIIGYSLNDTIVVFDRIRENRGRSAHVSTGLINQSINETLSRTVLTSMTTFLVVFVLYAFGGEGIRGFSFALLVGVVVGTYSSLGIATPLIDRPMVLRVVVKVLAALAVLGLIYAYIPNGIARLIGGIIVLAVFLYTTLKERRINTAGRPSPA